VRYLILSDIHANWEALQAVVAQARSSYDRIVCCGDLVGYGADPDAVTEWARDNVTVTIRGNHDKAVAGLEDLEWFNPIARQSVVWTQAKMKAANLDYLRGLNKGPDHVDGFQIVHGSPVDEDEYIVTPREVAQVAPYLQANVAFFGHTHLQGGFLCHRNGVKRLKTVGDDSANEAYELENDSVYYINSGSVGQPRDGDPRAAYAIYEPESRLVTLYRTEYDIASAQRKIIGAGLPEVLAVRLSAGV
jgi:predicted phosphodiesterase